MANRFPLIFNTSANQIQELGSGDNVDLTSSGIVNATSVGSTTLTVTSNATVGGDLTVTGNLVIDGTQTIINTTILDIEDINVGIATSATKLTDSQLDGAGITIYGSQGDKTLTWDNSNSRLSFNTDVYAPRFYGDGSGLQGVVSGIELQQAGSSVGTALTAINFASGATLTTGSGGISTITIAAGIQTEAGTPSNAVLTLDLSSAQDHKVTATGITTITVSGGTEGESHTVRVINSGIATVGFSTYFLFPSGSPPVLPTADGAISLVSFTVNQVGAAGTQLLAGASLNFS